MMKTLALLTLAAAAAVLPVQAATNIGVSIGINAPGQYGRIDINNYPYAVLDTPRPVIYAPSPYAVYQQPIYLYVSPAQQANWGNYCGRYSACGQPVHFVREDWVRREYGREYEQRHDGRKYKDQGHYDQGKHRGANKGQNNGHDKRGD